MSTRCRRGLGGRWWGRAPRVAGRGTGTRPGTPGALSAGPGAGTPLPPPSAQHGFSPGSLVTKKKKELCADPRAPWVQAHLKHFQTLKN